MANAPSVVSYAKDIRPLFRAKDVNSMRRVFDLANYDDVRANAKPILGRLTNGSMPCDGEWPTERVEMFRNWMYGGYNP